jgi:cell division protein FtsB
MTVRSGIIGRVLWAAVVAAALLFAVQGGEYSTLDLVRQRRDRRQLTTSIDSLDRVVDSLKRYRDRLLHDPKLQERIAREDFGMVRGTKELLYRFAEPRDSTDSTRKRR